MATINIKVDSSGLERRYEPIIKIVREEKVKTINELAAMGEQTIKEKIQNGGTDFSSVRRQYGIGQGGRVRSGRMLNSVGWKELGGRSMYSVALGYIKGFRADYFYYQEYGFRNVWKFVKFNGDSKSGPNAPEGFIFRRTSGKQTQGLFALRDAKDKVRYEKNAAGFRMKFMIKGRSRTV